MGKYTASDGKEFDTKREWRKYEMLLMYTFKEKTGETLPTKKPGDVNGQQFDMMNLTKCNLGVPRCCGAFTPSMRLVSIRRGRGCFFFRV
jgi:hypothetical protein